MTVSSNLIIKSTSIYTYVVFMPIPRGLSTPSLPKCAFRVIPLRNRPPDSLARHRHYLRHLYCAISASYPSGNATTLYRHDVVRAANIRGIEFTPHLYLFASRMRCFLATTQAILTSSLMETTLAL